jgi:hypothetical protein
MSSVSRNTRSQVNPNQAPPVVSQKIKITPTKVPRQETAEKNASEREAAINELVNTEIQIATNRAANLRSLARPLLKDNQANDVSGQASNVENLGDRGRGRSQARGGSRGGGESGGNRSRGGGGGRSRVHGGGPGPGQAVTTNDAQSASVAGPGEFDVLHPMYVLETNL